MNQRYISEAIICEEEELFSLPVPQGDPVLVYTTSTYPGSRLPHVKASYYPKKAGDLLKLCLQAWLSTPVPSQPVSTHDLAGKGVFSLFVGICGDKWIEAAKEASEKLDLPIATFKIGQGQEYTDLYQDWQNLRETEEDGCLLVRPDRTIGWRSKSLVDDPLSKILSILRAILAL